MFHHHSISLPRFWAPGALLGFAFIIGCSHVTSVDPIYDQNDLVVNRFLEGVWRCEGSLVSFEMIQRGHYRITCSDDDTPATQPATETEAALVQIGNRQFLFMEHNRQLDNIGMFRIDLQPECLQLQALNMERLCELVEPENLRYELSEPRLTQQGAASTQPSKLTRDMTITSDAAHIREFLIRHEADAKLFVPALILAPAD
jgi:hypothetical protein